LQAKEALPKGSAFFYVDLAREALSSFFSKK